MEMNGAVASSAILVMGLVGLFSVALPLGLALRDRLKEIKGGELYEARQY